MESQIITLEDGTPARKLPNGTLQHAETGKFLTGPSDESGHKITQANARKRAQKRWDDYRDASENAVIEKAKSLGYIGVHGSREAYALATGQQFELAMDISKGRDSTGAYKAVGQALDAIPDRRYHREDASQHDAAIIPVALASKILDLIAAGRQSDGE